MRSAIFANIFFGATLLLPLSSGIAQSLDEILRALQNRKKILSERTNVDVNIRNEYFYHPHELPHVPIEKIQWNGASEMPSHEEINNLSVETKLKLLNQAYREFDNLKDNFLEFRNYRNGFGKGDYLFFEPIETRVSAENYLEKIRILATRLSKLRELQWPVGTKYKVGGNVHIEGAPSPPYSIYHNEEEEKPYSDGTYTYPHKYEAYVANMNVGFFSSIDHEYNEGGGYTKKYQHGFGYDFASKIKATAPPSFKGNISIYADFPYHVKSISGLVIPIGMNGDGTANTLYHPGLQKWMDLNLQKGASSEMSPPGILGGDFGNLSFNSSWHEYTTPSDFELTYSTPILASQTSTQLWKDFWDPQSLNAAPRGWYKWPAGSTVGVWDWFFGSYMGTYNFEEYSFNFRFKAVLRCDFEDELSNFSRSIPEKSKPIQLAPDLKYSTIKIQLASEPENECELVWSFPLRTVQKEDAFPDYNYDGALAGRSALVARGGGDWDAVYSGNPIDREPELGWQGGRITPNKRWKNFDTYVKDWWRPVLRQLVCATYGVDIKQTNATKYVVIFYRRDQIGVKDSTTGLYPFTGTPVELIEVENPDESQSGRVKITTHKGSANESVYNLSLTHTEESMNSYIPDSQWTLQAKKGGAEFLSQDISITARKSGSSNGGLGEPFKVVDNTKLDGVALSIVTTTYWDSWANPLRIDRIVEEGGNQSRTTTFEYEKEEVNEIQQIKFLKRIVQTGGANDFTATYGNEAELLTHYKDMRIELDFSYDGKTLTKKGLMNGTVVRGISTTYSDDMTTATTIVTE